ncbi:ATP-dependent helicase HrpB [Acetobacter fallax]|uniref:ATP-dependent helicase HrpB n=1 Tax=Acetobacter fallax TaxID=1737473 RepID=A0ABX0K8G0_9PROT|nr:ATP-dependent helicase HrpB [Acetobacter fallax]NHO32692.1 ATP-dependent helicase HrpB [Acetobacter fallax]NHO36248.1 ATP-dependent helicase HrpB [Acetobacter fallax]
MVSSSSIDPAAVIAALLSASGDDLPVRACIPDLITSLEQEPNAVLVAPPGAGKTTLVPLALLQSGWRGARDRIVMLEPRRLAARAAAQRMSSLLGEPVGQTVGFRTRLESATSEATRIEVVTEGLFLRRLLSDPMLDGVACVIFDEIHERSLDADLALAFALDLQQALRPDLRLLAMSATADTVTLRDLMHAPVLESMGRQFPVTIRHAKRDLASARDLPQAAAQAVRESLAENEGDILVFLPGTGEIRRTTQFLEGVPALVLPLHGELPPGEQARVLTPEPDGRRRVILSTSIAETSLTVPGVRIVIDGGFRRAPRFDPGAGLARLETMRISRAAATQRSGRAGREAPGLGIRLWTEATGRGQAPHDRPEILDADLSDFALAISLWREAMGGEDTRLRFADTPPAGGLAAARDLLVLLGALDADGKPTESGRRMAVLGTHPRLAAMLLAARDAREAALAADLAALLEERDPLRPRMGGGRGGPPPIPPADIVLRLDLIAGDDHPDADRGALARIRQAAGQFRRRLRLPHGVQAVGDPAALIAAGFPDRIAQGRGEVGSFRLSGGGSARIGRADRLADRRLLAVASLFLRKSAEIRLAAPLDPDALPEALLARATEQVETALDSVSGSIMARRRLRIGALVLRDRTETVKSEDAAGLLLAQAAASLPTAFTWTDTIRQFQARVALARSALGRDDLPDLSDAVLAASAEDWLSPWLSGITTLSGLKDLDLLAILRARFSHADLVALDRDFPAELTLKGGRIRVDYMEPVPVASARAQVFYGTTETPRLAGGRVPLRLALLSPAGRPQALTADLAAFWTGGWLDMRRDMRGRYPRHDWPENPAIAEPPAPRGERPGGSGKQGKR